MIRESPLWLTFINRNQALLGKTIIALRRHEEEVASITPEEWVELQHEVGWVDYMLRAAIMRRQLTASQRAALVVERDHYHRLQAGARRRQRANLAQASEVATLPPRGKTREHEACIATTS